MKQRPPLLEQFPGLEDAVGRFDHWDAFSAESRKDLRGFIAAFFSHRPNWLRLLFALRKPLARMLGLKHSLESERAFTPQDIPFAKGAAVWIFMVAGAEEGTYWAGKVEDAHLRAVLVFVCEPLDNGYSRYTTVTFVTYNDWRGPVYFTLIRPFHDIVIKTKVKASAV